MSAWNAPYDDSELAKLMTLELHPAENSCYSKNHCRKAK